MIEICENVVYGGLEPELACFTAWTVRGGQVFIGRVHVPPFTVSATGIHAGYEWVQKRAFLRALHELEQLMGTTTGKPAPVHATTHDGTPRKIR